MAWWFAVVEARHDIQNPTSPEKIRLLGERMELGPDSRVLDVASGRGGPALVLAKSTACRVTCVEKAEEFVRAATDRVAAAGLHGRIEMIHADARDLPLSAGPYDAALCLGASFVWGGLEATVATLAQAVRTNGFVAVGEPFWRTWPLPQGFEPDEGEAFTTLPETVSRFESSGLGLVTVIVSSEDDWDRYETLRWLTLDKWLHDHPKHPDAQRFRDEGRRRKSRYLTWERDLLGWAILVGRIPATRVAG
jgi:SAM-dependent methyltransferase